MFHKWDYSVHANRKSCRWMSECIGVHKPQDYVMILWKLTTIRRYMMYSKNKIAQAQVDDYLGNRVICNDSILHGFGSVPTLLKIYFSTTMLWSALIQERNISLFSFLVWTEQVFCNLINKIRCCGLWCVCSARAGLFYLAVYIVLVLNFSCVNWLTDNGFFSYKCKWHFLSAICNNKQFGRLMVYKLFLYMCDLVGVLKINVTTFISDRHLLENRLYSAEEYVYA